MTEREIEEWVDAELALLKQHLASGLMDQEDYDTDVATTLEWAAEAYAKGWLTGP